MLAGFAAGPAARVRAQPAPGASASKTETPLGAPAGVRLFLCGDLMTGRGIDQILARPSKPDLSELLVKSAVEYVDIAERASGPIPRRVDPAYIWGDALGELDRARPHVRIVNLETAVTIAEDAWPGKDIHYRMHPANVGCLSAARIDCCTLANNHVLDWGYDGLRETTATLRDAGIRTAGAGGDQHEASAPAVIDLRAGGRVLVFAYGSPTSGVPQAWAARRRQPGVSIIDEYDDGAAERVARAVREVSRAGDIVIASLHWGSNWGYDIPRAQQRFAHRLIDDAGVHVVYGHSSHHPRPIEVHRGQLILHGCGDFLNDYEGIAGYEAFRPQIGLMYLPELDATNGRLLRLNLRPTRIRQFQVQRASAEEADWLQETLSREGQAFGTRIDRRADGTLDLRWG